MKFYLFLMYCAAVSALSRIKEPDLEATNFAKAIHGKKLNGSVFQEISVDSEISCQIACVKEIRCLSYNFRASITKDEDEFICELSDSDRFTGQENFIEDGGVLYRGIQVIVFEMFVRLNVKSSCLSPIKVLLNIPYTAF